MKKILLVLLSLLSAVFILGSCSNEQKEPSKPKPPVTEPLPTPDVPEVPKVDFTLKKTCDAGSIESEEFVFSEINPNEKYYNFNDPEIVVMINQADWAYVSMINQDNTKFQVENASVFSEKGITYKPVMNNSGTISSITLTLDRTKMHEGQTKIKFTIDPANGTTSASNIELCFNLKVVKFGSFDPKMADVKLNLDLSNLDSKLVTDKVEINVQDQEYVYGYSYKTVTTKEVTKDTKELTISVPLGHKVLLFVRGYDSNNKMFSYYLNLSSDNSFELVNTNHIFNSVPTSVIDARIGDKI